MDCLNLCVFCLGFELLSNGLTTIYKQAIFENVKSSFKDCFLMFQITMDFWDIINCDRIRIKSFTIFMDASVIQQFILLF